MEYNQNVLQYSNQTFQGLQSEGNAMNARELEVSVYKGGKQRRTTAGSGLCVLNGLFPAEMQKF